jgi:hypothetical protein
MNKEFMQKFVHQTIEQLLSQTVISQSQESTDLTSSVSIAGKAFKKFSISDHILFLVANICKSFDFDGVYMVVGGLIKDSLCSKAPLFTHFSTYYENVI